MDVEAEMPMRLYNQSSQINTLFSFSSTGTAKNKVLKRIITPN